jgi:hypothetical protein
LKTNTRIVDTLEDADSWAASKSGFKAASVSNKAVVSSIVDYSFVLSFV